MLNPFLSPEKYSSLLKATDRVGCFELLRRMRRQWKKWYQYKKTDQSFEALVFELVSSHFDFDCNLAKGSSLKILSSFLEKHILGLAELVNVAHQKGAATGGTARRDCLKYSYFSSVGACGYGQMNIAISFGYCSSEIIFSFKHHNYLRPSFWPDCFQGDLKGKVPDDFSCVGGGALADTGFLSVHDFPVFWADGGVKKG